MSRFDCTRVCGLTFASILNRAEKIERKQLELKKLVGSGSFGEVYHGLLTGRSKKPLFDRHSVLC
jgi:hypothetical protein